MRTKRKPARLSDEALLANVKAEMARPRIPITVERELKQCADDERAARGPEAVARLAN